MLNRRREKRTRNSRGDVWPSGFPLSFVFRLSVFPLFPSFLSSLCFMVLCHWNFCVLSICVWVSVINILVSCLFQVLCSEWASSGFHWHYRVLSVFLVCCWSLIVSHFGSALLPGITRNEPNLEFLASRHTYCCAPNWRTAALCSRSFSRSAA